MRRYRLELTGRKDREGPLGIALATAAGFGAGLLGGIILGEWLGAVHPERVRGLFGKKPAPAPADPARLERDVLRVLRNTSATRRLALSARALDGGLIELTGVAPDERTRLVAGEAAAGIAGADVVVNRILVEGRDVPPGHTLPSNR